MRDSGPKSADLAQLNMVYFEMNDVVVTEFLAGVVQKTGMRERYCSTKTETQHTEVSVLKRFVQLCVIHITMEEIPCLWITSPKGNIQYIRRTKLVQDLSPDKYDENQFNAVPHTVKL